MYTETQFLEFLWTEAQQMDFCEVYDEFVDSYKALGNKDPGEAPHAGVTRW